MVEVVFEDRGASAVWVARNRKSALLPISIGQACRRFAGTPVRPNVNNHPIDRLLIFLRHTSTLPTQ
jgi:hypothetical protein